MKYVNHGLLKFSLTVWNNRDTTYTPDGKEEVEIVTIGLGTRGYMDEATLSLRPAEARRLAEALMTASSRNYSDVNENDFRTNVIPVVGLFSWQFNMKTGENDCTCCTCGHEWSMHTLEEIEACPNCGVLPEDRW